MNEIKCPNCKTVFQIDEKDYQSIVKQIRDQEFEKEIERKEREFEKDKESSLKLVESNLKEKFKEELHQKEIELQELKNDIKIKEDNQEKELKIKESEWKEKSKEEIEKLTIEINNLKKDLDLKDKDKELAIKDTIYEKEKEVQKLKNDLVTVKETFEEKIKNKDEQIAYYKDFKARQSTKMIGESLEQHCSTEFNQIRPLFGENVYFDKDNDAKTGSKGDFIFRETDDDGIEILSIMFEMKNEADETATKHKNEDF